MNGRARELVKNNDFGTKDNITRGLSDYGLMFPIEFMKALSKLGPEDHWVDGGSGDSVAVEEYASGKLHKTINSYWYKIPKDLNHFLNVQSKPSDQRAHVTGITVEGKIPPKNAQMRILKGRFLEDIPLEEITEAPFGKAKLITDMYGAMAYSDRPDLVLKHYLNMLGPGGSIFIKNDYMGGTVIVGEDGRSVKNLVQWLESIPGVSVKRFPNSNSIEIQKTAENPVEVPTLTLRRTSNHLPPRRELIQGSNDKLHLSDFLAKEPKWRQAFDNYWYKSGITNPFPSGNQIQGR